MLIFCFLQILYFWTFSPQFSIIFYSESCSTSKNTSIQLAWSSLMRKNENEKEWETLSHQLILSHFSHFCLCELHTHTHINEINDTYHIIYVPYILAYPSPKNMIFEDFKEGFTSFSELAYISIPMCM